MLIAALLVRPASARRAFAHLLHGTNCTARVEKDECILNPLFMEQECAGACSHLRFVDAHHDCELKVKECYGMNQEGVLFVRRLCNATCRHHFLEVEDALAPSDAVVLLHAVLPVLYLLAFVVVLVLQLLTGPWAEQLMLWLEPRRAAGSVWAAKVQTGLLALVEPNETHSAAQHVGRLFVCGYFVVEGGVIFGSLALLVLVLKRRLRVAVYVATATCAACNTTDAGLQIRSSDAGLQVRAALLLRHGGADGAGQRRAALLVHEGLLHERADGHDAVGLAVHPARGHGPISPPGAAQRSGRSKRSRGAAAAARRLAVA